MQLVHFANRDSLGLANDFLSLGFLPDGVDIQSVSEALQVSFGDGTRQSQDFQGIMNQLYDVMYDFNFSLPPDYALVIRALGSLEGTPKALDPDFKVVESAYPFVIGRLFVDPTPDMRRILRELLIRNDGSIRWNRLERLERGMLVRVVSGFHSLVRAMKLAPDLWSAMAIRMVVKPEFQRFACDIGSALISHFKYHLPVSFWMGISRILHRVVNKDEGEVL
ncbi:hypothetical protein K7X08_029078 [Anisodus acutangulus]|uniref:Uncharacterized protein n=1 Tax=Anisodus acutangulus TaxID=402998 RepID=A0A9Q1L3V5_9SOLA|nr:hypothetical protein K7X08_029078 [Anisodus acutangulus]